MKLIPENNSENRHELAAYMSKEHGMDYQSLLELYENPTDGDKNFADHWGSEYNYWEIMFMEMSKGVL